eukprot:5984240-Prymnesium_polylepis.2
MEFSDPKKIWSVSARMVRVPISCPEPHTLHARTDLAMCAECNRDPRVLRVSAWEHIESGWSIAEL